MISLIAEFIKERGSASILLYQPPYQRPKYAPAMIRQRASGLLQYARTHRRMSTNHAPACIDTEDLRWVEQAQQRNLHVFNPIMSATKNGLTTWLYARLVDTTECLISSRRSSRGSWPCGECDHLAPGTLRQLKDIPSTTRGERAPCPPPLVKLFKNGTTSLFVPSQLIQPPPAWSEAQGESR